MRQTAGRVRLCMADSGLKRVRVLADAGEPSPDRRPRIGATGWTGEERPVWGPRDSFVLYPRCTWIAAGTGVEVPGSAVWWYSFSTGRSYPFATPVQPRETGGEPPAYCLRSPTVRDDGGFAALVGERPGPETCLMMRPLAMRPPGASEIRADEYMLADWPAWEPGGRRLAFAQGALREATADRVASIRVIEPGGLVAFEAVRITVRRYRELCPSDAVLHPNVPPDPWISGVNWSKDGRRIYFALTADATDKARFSLWSVRAEPDGVPVREDPDDGMGYLAPRPYEHEAVGAVCWRRNRAHAVLLAGTRRMDASQDLPSDDLDWSPDASSVVVSAGRPSTASAVGLKLYRIRSWPPAARERRQPP